MILKCSNNLNINIKINRFLKILEIKHHYIYEKFKNYFFIEYKDKNNLCVNNLSNDYILSTYEKKIENFFFKRNRVYKTISAKFKEYFVNFTLDFILPINLALKISRDKDNLNAIIVSILWNSSTKMNDLDEDNLIQN